MLPFPAKSRNLARSLAAAENNPLSDLVETGDLAVDTAAQFALIHKAFRGRREREDRRFSDATDSEYWVALCFLSRAEKEAFLDEFRLRDLGDKYLDGAEVRERLLG